MFFFQSVIAIKHTMLETKNSYLTISYITDQPPSVINTPINQTSNYTTNAIR